MKRMARGVGGLLILAMAGCVSPTSDLDGPGAVERADALEVRLDDGVFLLTQAVQLQAYPDALYMGAVTVDGEGCIRLAEAGGAVTVVWPMGFTLEAVDGGHVVVDGEDRTVGRLGEDFQMGGGEVPSLHGGLGFTQADQNLAASRCPGKFWIASPGEVTGA